MRRLSPDNRSPTGFLADNPMSGFAEAFRALRTTILRSDVGRPPKVVAVTSAAPGEGKTTTSVCLARITAASGQRVLLIDCDLRSRSLHQFIQGVPDKGLLQALIGDVPWRDLLKQDIDSAVHILPLAPTSIVPRGVLGSDAMRNFLAEAAAAYDLVICDCAPVLTGMETRVLARAADTTIVVARSGKTPARVVRDTVRQLRESGATIAGVVLNGLDPRSAASSSYDAPYVGKAYQKYYAS
jgi:capsular exopolysaccharide synthesis family protein